MEIIQTLYSSPNTSYLRKSFGWLAPEYHLMSWALSCLQLRKFYKKVHLFTNYEGIDILIKNLKLPYTQIHCSHNHFDLPHPDLWALPKIYTYSLQKKPFLHVDGDVYIFKSFPKSFGDNLLIAQNEEIATIYYTTSQVELMKYFSFLPEPVRKDFQSKQLIHAVNAGILGGRDVDFFKKYTKLAFEYVNKNIHAFPLINVNKFNVFFEQHLFYSYAKYRGIKITYLLDNLIKDNQFRGFGNFWEVPLGRTYLHLLGDYKRNEFICLQLANCLKKRYSEYYYRIISLFKKNQIPLKHDYYLEENLSNYVKFKNFYKTSKKVYKKYKYEKNINETKSNSHENVMNKIRVSKENIYLNNLIDKLKENSVYNIKEVKKDQFDFLKKINDSLQKRNSYPAGYLYGRDLEALDWYYTVFKDKSNIKKVILVKCHEISTFSTKYNWGALWCGYTNAGAPYYKSLRLETGGHMTMIVPEAFENGFSVYDLEELEKILLNLLDRPLSVREVYNDMKKYFEDEIFADKLSELQLLLNNNLEELILKKAIKPYKI